jgi:hypothetical protein
MKSIIPIKNPRILALLIGIEYLGTPNELLGCARDVDNMYKLLVNTLGLLPSDITILKEENGNLPTKKNILQNIDDIARKSKEINAQQTIIYYSGHGTQVPGDERDRKDEALVPLDFNDGLIIDNTLRTYLDKIPKTTLCMTIFDCCNSASVGDLPYHFNYNNIDKNCVCVKDMISNYPKSENSIFCISGCKDNQVSSVIRENGIWESALTNAVINIFETKKEVITYFQLVQYLTEYMIDKKLTQRPVLSTSWNTKPGKLITDKRNDIKLPIIRNDIREEVDILSYLSLF